MSSLKNVTVLVPGRLNDHAVERVGREFELVRMPRTQVAGMAPDAARKVRAIASMTVVDAGMIDALPNLEIIVNFGVGYDVVDTAHAARRGIVVTNTPDVLTEEVADTTVGLLINTVRQLPKAERWLREGSWPREKSFPLVGMTLRGRRAGIFGMGRIGQAIARRLEAFGMPIAYHNRRPVEGSAYTYHPTLAGLAEAVDTLIAVAPGGSATQNAIDAGVLSALGPDGVLVNVGRGSTVDEAALIAALENGTIGAAGLDVFADEPNVPEGLLKLDNACLLPHVGSSTVHTRQAMADLQVDNLVSWFSKGVALTPVEETRHVSPPRR